MNICSAPFAPSYWIPHLLANTPGVCTDTFDRADSATVLGVADSGQTWSAVSWGITGNLAKASGAVNSTALLQCYNPDVTVSVEMTVNSGVAGLIVRAISTGSYLRVTFNSGNLELHSVAGSATLITSVAHTAANGDILKVVCLGTSIDIYVNNSLKISTTSALNQFAGTQQGLYANANSAVRFNNFNVVTPTPIDVTDSFNRADNASSLGTADSGHIWTTHGGTWGIQTNRAYQPGGIFGVAAVISNRADCTIQATLPVNSTNGGGLAFRITSGVNLIRAAWNGGTLFLIKRVNSVDTTLASTVFANANGQVLKVVLLGSSISVYVDNVLKLGPVTETFNQVASQHGLFSGSAPVIRYEDFSIVA